MSVVPFLSSTSTSSRTTTRLRLLLARCVVIALEMSSAEKPLVGNPGSKCLTICRSAPTSELFLQLMNMTSIGLPALAM